VRPLLGRHHEPPGAWTGWDYSLYRSPEWWDQQAALQDLKHAAEVAANLWPTGN
jgi:hypothetical protein